MRRQCGRTGCARIATATMSFAPGEPIVWLDPIRDEGQSAGDLCARHADRLVPPHGWTLEDRRIVRAVLSTPTTPAPAATSPSPASRERESAPSAGSVATISGDRAAAPTGDEPAWMPQFGIDDLDGLLHADTPLLARAFRAAKAI